MLLVEMDDPGAAVGPPHLEPARGDRTLPEPVQRVSAFLESAGVEACLHEFSEGAATAEAAARAVGCETDQIVKSLIFICDNEPTLVMVSGASRADDAKIREIIGAAAVKIAKPAVVLDRTGFEVGGVAPFPLPKVKTALCDHRLLSHPVVWAGAGSASYMLALAPHDLIRLAHARPADVSARPAASG